MNKLVEKTQELLSKSPLTSLEYGMFARYADAKYEVLARVDGSSTITIKDLESREYVFNGDENSPDNDSETEVAEYFQGVIDGKKETEETPKVAPIEEDVPVDGGKSVGDGEESHGVITPPLGVDKEKVENGEPAVVSPFAGMFGGNDDNDVTSNSGSDESGN